MFKQVVKISLHVIFWLVSTYIVVQLFSFEGEDVEFINGVEVVSRMFNSEMRYVLLATTIFKIAFYYINLFYLSTLFFAKIHAKYWVLFLATIGAFLLLEYIAVSLMFSGRLNFRGYFILGVGLYLFYGILSLAYSFYRQRQSDQVAKEELKQQKASAELKLLRSQINPHFLFNALNNLLSIAEKEEQKVVSKGISQLSDLLRYMLYDNSEEKVMLSKEIEFIENYIQLYKLRFDDKDEIHISFDIEGGADGVFIAPAILISFVENAFKHGINIYKPSFINIMLKITASKVLFNVLNSHHSMSVHNEFHQERGGIGLENVKKRLDILYKNNYILNIVKNTNDFTINLELNL